jgi:hypothetical protein
MAFTYGFYNSQDGDRVYDADQFSSFLDGIVYDGVYEAVGDKFYVTSLEDENLTIQVGAGRAWLKHTWSLNDTNLYLTASAALDVYDRIDAVVLEVNKTNRENVIKIVEGDPSDSNPQRPDLTNEDNVRQYPLAYIYREHGTTKIPNTHAGTSETATENATECIKFMVGSSALPLCSALALAGVPSGGKIGQVLAKSSSESGSVGWYDVTKLPYDVWYLTDTVGESDVIAAYKFTNRLTQAEALENVNDGTKYTLTVSNCTWSSDTGFYIGKYSGGLGTGTRPTGSGLINTSLLSVASTSGVSMVAYCAGNDISTANGACAIWLNSKKKLFLKSGQGYEAAWANFTWFKTPGYSGYSGTDNQFTYSASEGITEGVIGVDFSTNKLYVNGDAVSVTTNKYSAASVFTGGDNIMFGNPRPGRTWTGTYKYPEDNNHTVDFTGYWHSASAYYLKAVAIYSKTVPDTDMVKIYQSMSQL